MEMKDAIAFLALCLSPIPAIITGYFAIKMCSDPKKLDRKVAFAIKLMPLGFKFDWGQILQG